MLGGSGSVLARWSSARAAQDEFIAFPGPIGGGVCLLLCIRLVGGFIGNTDKTLCWSAVCIASAGWDVAACASHRVEEGSPGEMSMVGE